MTKQEEIREGIALMAYNLRFDMWGDRAMPYAVITERDYKQADIILSYLHSQGVVIKAERELPNIQFIKGNQAFVDAVNKAGYVAVEPIRTE